MGSTIRASAFVLAVLLNVSPARADDDKQRALDLFHQARALMDQHKYDDACPKLAESYRLDPGGGTLLNLALCHDKQGKIATAWTEYHEALSRAQKDGRKEREQFASERIAALSPRVPRLTVEVPAPVQGIAVKVDGVVIGPGLWGHPQPIDPGKHRVEATAKGHHPFATEVKLDEGQNVGVQVPALQSDVPVPPASKVCPPDTTWNGTACIAPQVDAPVVKAPQPTTRDNPLFFVMGGVTIVSGATSLVTGVYALTINVGSRCSSQRDFCPDQASLDANSNARTMAWISTITMGIGIVAGITWAFVPVKIKRTEVSISDGIYLRGVF